MVTIHEWTALADFCGAAAIPLSLAALFVALYLIPDQLEF